MRGHVAVVAVLLSACAAPPARPATITVPIAPVSASPPAYTDAARVVPPSEHASEVVVLLDMSSSMRAIEEVAFGPRASDPRTASTPTRFDVARSVALRLVELAARRGTSDWIGVVGFGKEARVLSPLTNDHAALGALLRRTSLGAVDPSGTELGDAILRGLELVDVPRVPREGDARDDPTKNDTPRTLLVVTDGHVGDAPTRFEAITAARRAAERHVRVSVIAIDDRERVDVEDGVDLFGKPTRVRLAFPVDRPLLSLCASEGRGRLFLAPTSDAAGLERELHWAFPD